MKYELTTRAVDGTPYTIYVLLDKGVELRRQLSAFDKTEAQALVRRHREGSLRGHNGVAPVFTFRPNKATGKLEEVK